MEDKNNRDREMDLLNDSIFKALDEQELFKKRIKKLEMRLYNKEGRDRERLKNIRNDLNKIFTIIKDRDFIKEIDILQKENQKFKEEVLTLSVELKKLRDNITSKIFL